MTLALPDTRTPIFDQLLAEAHGLADFDLHFETARRHLADGLDAHFASIPVDTAPVVINAEVIDVVDTPDAAPADDNIERKPIRFDLAICILAVGVAIGAIFFLRFTVGIA